MARKRDQIQIQVDVTTQQEWEEEISKPGLTVVDVYPGWCGPCMSMQSVLKKIKFELGDDDLRFVSARADKIDALETFRGRCEPLWIFFGSGAPVFQLRGAHAPNLSRAILDELAKEKKAMAGGAERAVINLECDAPAEVEMPEVPDLDEAETAASLNARRLRSEIRVRKALSSYSLVVFSASIADWRTEIRAVLEERGFTFGPEVSKTLTEEEADMLVVPPKPEPAPEPEPAPSAEVVGEGGEEEGDGEAEGVEAKASEEEADGDAPPAEEEAAEGGREEKEGGEPPQEDPEALAKREAVKEKLLEGESVIIAIQDSQFSEDKPYRWLTLYLGKAPEAPPDVIIPEPSVPATAASGAEVDGEAAEGEGEDQGEEGGEAAREGEEGEPAAEGEGEAPAEGDKEAPEVGEEAAPAEGETAEGEEAQEGEPEQTIEDQLTALLEENSNGFFTPITVLGQWTGLRAYFPDLYRAAAPTAAPLAEIVAFAVFAGDREATAQTLTDAGLRILHSGTDVLPEEVAAQLVSDIDGAEDQQAALTAAPVYAAAVAGTGQTQTAALAGMDPLYLSPNPERADADAKAVFSAWGVEINTLLPAAPAEPAPEGAAQVEGGQVAPPADGGKAPAEGGEVPAEAGEAPAGGAEAPAEGGEAPAEGGQAPAEGGETPAEGGEAPAEGGQAPAEGGETPAEGGEMPKEEEASAEGEAAKGDAAPKEGEDGAEVPAMEGGPLAEEAEAEAPAEEEPAAKEAPATEEAPVSEEAPAEEAPAEEAPAEEAPAEEAPAEDTPTEESPAEKAPTEEAPAEEAPAEEAPAEEAPTEEAPAEEAPAEEAPA